MPDIENWGFNYENETMKGYVLYALAQIKRQEPKLQLSDDQKEILLKAINWATSDLTAQEAYQYYCNN